jgi:hypothetical protein
MPSMNQLSNYKTTIHTDDGITKVVYTNTCIVAFCREAVVLNSGGYESVTTKRKMNQASNQFMLGYQVVQKDFKWYVDTLSGRHDFADMMTVNTNTGEVNYV